MSNEAGGKICGVCFMIFWCGVVFSFAFMALSSGAPFIFTLVPIGMGIFGIVMCIGIAKGGVGRSKTAGSFTIKSVDTSYGDYMARPVRASRTGERLLFQVPSKCPECGANISQETVDWVGPLQAECPYCHATIDVEKKSF